MAVVNDGFAIWRYVLRFRGAANRRSGRREIEGFLLREDGGYGCVQPWPEFGHRPLEEQLEAIEAGKRTVLLDAARRCAAVDRGWRKLGRSMFEGLDVPPSHATVIDPGQQAGEAWQAGFRVFKLKCGATAGDADLLRGLVDEFPELRLRLDLNEVAERAEFDDWWRSLEAGVRQRVEFVEDPIPFDGDGWRELSREHGVPLAVDRRAAMALAGEAAVRVIKPAWGEPEILMEEEWPEKIVFTSAMDHPLGQAWAARGAGIGARQMPGRVLTCGLQTHHLFEVDSFSERLGPWQPQFRSPGGTGLGFDDLLEELDWEVLG